MQQPRRPSDAVEEQQRSTAIEPVRATPEEMEHKYDDPETTSTSTVTARDYEQTLFRDMGVDDLVDEANSLRPPIPPPLRDVPSLSDEQPRSEERGRLPTTGDQLHSTASDQDAVSLSDVTRARLVSVPPPRRDVSQLIDIIIVDPKHQRLRERQFITSRDELLLWALREEEAQERHSKFQVLRYRTARILWEQLSFRSYAASKRAVRWLRAHALAAAYSRGLARRPALPRLAYSEAPVSRPTAVLHNPNALHTILALRNRLAPSPMEDRVGQVLHFAL